MLITWLSKSWVTAASAGERTLMCISSRGCEWTVSTVAEHRQTHTHIRLSRCLMWTTHRLSPHSEPVYVLKAVSRVLLWVSDREVGNTDLEEPGENIRGLPSDYKQPGVELLQAAVQVLQRLQQEPAHQWGESQKHEDLALCLSPDHHDSSGAVQRFWSREELLIFRKRKLQFYPRGSDLL